VGGEPRSSARLGLVLCASCVFLVAGASGASGLGREGPAPASQSDPRETVASLLGTISAWAESRPSSPAPSGPLFARPLVGPVTSPFGWRYGREHTGVDIDGDTGDRVVAAAAGSIVHAGPYFGYGETVMIDHGSGFGTLYGHLSRIDAAVGQEVRQGQGIGLVGCTGACSGDHLHFEIRINSEPVDPLSFLQDARVARPESIPASPIAVAASGPSVR
jgi:murein DD-endopeptidase MepM/ murein hydrolase activator NlpD